MRLNEMRRRQTRPNKNHKTNQGGWRAELDKARVFHNNQGGTVPYREHTPTRLCPTAFILVSKGVWAWPWPWVLSARKQSPLSEHKNENSLRTPRRCRSAV